MLTIFLVKKSVHSSEQVALQALLRQLRKEAGLQQVELAVILGKYQTFVSRYEVGEKMLDLPELRQVCHALGIALPDFVNRYEEALKKQ